MSKKKNQNQLSNDNDNGLIIADIVSSDVTVENVTDYTVTAIINTDIADRNGNVILPSGMQNVEDFINSGGKVLANHNSYGGLTENIGQVLEITSGKIDNKDAIFAKIKYFAGVGNTEADWGWFLAQSKVATYSVGIHVIASIQPTPEDFVKYETNDIYRIITAWELVEVSQVTIPANKDAIVQLAAAYQGDINEVVEDTPIDNTEDKPETDNTEEPKDSNIVKMLEEILNKIEILINDNKDAVDGDINNVVQEQSEKITELEQKITAAYSLRDNQKPSQSFETHSTDVDEIRNVVRKAMGIK